MDGWSALEQEIRREAKGVLDAQRPDLDAVAREAQLRAIVERLRSRRSIRPEDLGTSDKREEFRAFVRLFAEYVAVGVGQEIARRLHDVAARLRLDEPHERVNNLVVALLDNEWRQLDAVMMRASTVAEFDALIAGRFGWRETRDKVQRTVLDNVVERAGEILAEAPFIEVQRIHGRPAYSRRDSSKAWAEPTRIDLMNAARAAMRVPRTPVRERATRAPAVYSDPRLREVLDLIADALPGAFTLDDVRSVLIHVLAGYTPIFSYADGELEQLPGSMPSTEDEALGRAAAERTLDALTGEVRDVTALNLLDLERVVVAKVVGRTPPTVDDRWKTKAAEIFREQLSGLSDGARSVALETVNLALRGEAMTLVCRWLVTEPPFVEVDAAKGTGRYAMSRTAAGGRPPSEAEFADAVMAVARLDDAGKPLSVSWFRRALEAAMGALAIGVTPEEAAGILEAALTFPGEAVLTEGDGK